MENKIIAVDFDGTLCKNKWPGIGEANKEMITYLKDRQENGDKLILWTCRVDDMLKNAIDWSADQGLIFDAVNENLPDDYGVPGYYCSALLVEGVRYL